MKFSCPGCGASLKVSEDQVGRKFRCPKCRQPVRVGRPATEQTATEPPPSLPDEQPQVQESPVQEPPAQQPPVAEETVGDPWDEFGSDGEDWESALGELPEETAEAPPPLPGRRRESIYSQPVRWGAGHSKRDRFWVLQLIVSWGYITAAFIGLLFFAAGVYLCYQSSQFAGDLTWGLVMMLVCWLLGILIVLPYLAYIQILDCFLAIEENTRRTADR